MRECYDYAVIGAGFFGVRITLLLAKLGARVALIEREAAIFTRASFCNQARVHHGYHYLRSYSTARGSRLNYDRFCAEMSDCIDDRFDHVYGIAKHGSYTNTVQFQSFCRELGLPLQRVPAHIKKMFDPSRVEDLFLVRECAFDASAIRQKLARELEAQPNVTLLLNRECQRIDFGRDLLALQLRGTAPIDAHGAFIVTYANINQLLLASGLEPLAMKAELAEVCLVEVPSALQNMAITVMDGPFFSLMPMPATGAYSFSHVRYTPHVSWDLADSPSFRGVAGYDAEESRFAFMKKDAARYAPILAALKYRRSLFEIKALPKNHELDDGRPILFHRHLMHPPCISILGSKIDSVFELERVIAALQDQSVMSPLARD
jgi:glycine/D-amino acid oxidase-like deaminating enzyme